MNDVATFQARLGSDLAALLDRLPSRLTGATAITGLRAPALQRATFRLRLSDGTILKGRRMDSSEDAERVERLAEHLDGDSFARPLMRHGAALLEPWVVGVRLDKAAPDEALLRSCGALLGRVHSARIDLNGEARRWTPDVRLRNVLGRLDQLSGLGRLSLRDNERLALFLETAVPKVAPTGLIHRDLWPRNIVVDADRRPHVVDNGSLALGAHEFDLARTAYLWPMSKAHAAAFADGYGAAGPRAAEQSVFWTVDVLAEVALFRLLAGARGAGRPLALLRALAAATPTMA